MNNKKRGEAKASPKGDTTQRRRQSRRREKLSEIARAAGWESWSAYETAVINVQAILQDKPYCQCTNPDHSEMKDGTWCRNCGFPVKEGRS